MTCNKEAFYVAGIFITPCIRKERESLILELLSYFAFVTSEHMKAYQVLFPASTLYKTEEKIECSI